MGREKRKRHISTELLIVQSRGGSCLLERAFAHFRQVVRPHYRRNWSRDNYGKGHTLTGIAQLYITLSFYIYPSYQDHEDGLGEISGFLNLPNVTSLNKSPVSDSHYLFGFFHFLTEDSLPNLGYKDRSVRTHLRAQTPITTTQCQKLQIAVGTPPAINF